MENPVILDESFLLPLHRHVINIMCLDSGPAALKECDGKCAVYNFSAFVVEIADRWFAISAGHIFRELQNIVAHGAILSDWQIDDSIVSNKPQQAYRISVDLAQDVMSLHDEIDGIDYAFLELDYLTRQALTKEGIQAIPSTIWAKEDLADFSMWMLVGTPNILSHLVAGQPIIKNHATIHVVRTWDVPAGLNNTEYRRLYARIDFESVMEQEQGFDIRGMSGGPIFGVRPSTSGVPYEYRLIGIQSAWNENDHIAICAAYPFVQMIAQKIAVQGQ